MTSALEEFAGSIYQRPPLKSAVKRRLRIRRTNAIELIERKDSFFLLRVDVEAGTYIRKLFHDIGEVLGAGASMRELRRIRVGPLHESDGVTLQQLEEAHLQWERGGEEKGLKSAVIPVENVLDSLIPKIVVKDTAVGAIAHGATVKVPGICAFTPNFDRGDVVGIFTLKNEIVALARAEMSAKTISELDRGVAAKPFRVIIEMGLYPDLWKKRSDSLER